MAALGPIFQSLTTSSGSTGSADPAITSDVRPLTIDISCNLNVEDDILRTESAVGGLERDGVSRKEEQPQRNAKPVLPAWDRGETRGLKVGHEASLGGFGVDAVDGVAVNIPILDNVAFPEGERDALADVAAEEGATTGVRSQFDGADGVGDVSIRFDAGISSGLHIPDA